MLTDRNKMQIVPSTVAASLGLVVMAAITNMDYASHLDPESGTSGHDRTSLCAADVRLPAHRPVPGSQ